METNFNLHAYEFALLVEQRRLMLNLKEELEKNPDDKLAEALLYLVKKGGLHR